MQTLQYAANQRQVIPTLGARFETGPASYLPGTIASNRISRSKGRIMGKGRVHRSLETSVVHGSKGFDPTTGAVSFPIYQTATFRHPEIGASTGYDYSRQENPTRNELEETVAVLESGTSGFAFSTGMAAIAAVLDLFEAGDRILYSEDLY